MSRNLIFVLLASGLAVSAFSLERHRISHHSLSKIFSPTKRTAHDNLVTRWKSKRGSFSENDDVSSNSSKDPAISSTAFPMVASAREEHQLINKNRSLKDMIWNDNTKLVFYLGVWYLGNIYYNIYNKKACIALGKNPVTGTTNAVWLLSALQLLVGIVFVLPLWLFRIRPFPTEMFRHPERWLMLSPIGLWTALAHAFSVLALSAGTVSFGQIVKAGEPVFAALTNIFLSPAPVSVTHHSEDQTASLDHTMSTQPPSSRYNIDHPMVYLSLLPIVGGVALASLKELSFSWTALLAAMAANQAAALKNVASKNVMESHTQHSVRASKDTRWVKAMGPQNLFATITFLAFMMTLPLVLAFDLPQLPRLWQELQASQSLPVILKYTVLSGLTFYLYNEASFLALECIHPVTHSVANTVKRVVIVATACLVFQTPMTPLGAIGSAVAILGTLLYSLAKRKYHKKH